MALTLYEAGLCSGCGQPASSAWDMDSGLMYGIEIHTCYVCEQIEKHHKKYEKGAPAGQKISIENMRKWAPPR